MTIETWYKIWCDKCGVVNWLCDGDTSDMTGVDVEGFICHKCQAVHSIVEDEFCEPGGYEIGMEKPE